MGRFIAYVTLGIVIAVVLITQYGFLQETTRVIVPNPPARERTADRSEAGEALGDLFGGTAPARDMPRTSAAGDIPRIPAPRGDTIILTAPGGS